MCPLSSAFCHYNIYIGQSEIPHLFTPLASTKNLETPTTNRPIVLLLSCRPCFVRKCLLPHMNAWLDLPQLDWWPLLRLFPGQNGRPNRTLVGYPQNVTKERNQSQSIARQNQFPRQFVSAFGFLFCKGNRHRTWFSVCCARIFVAPCLTSTWWIVEWVGKCWENRRAFRRAFTSCIVSFCGMGGIRARYRTREQQW